MGPYIRFYITSRTKGISFKGTGVPLVSLIHEFAILNRVSEESAVGLNGVPSQ